MTTLITARKRDGTTRRCDAKCHNARGRTCHCICGGINHGISHQPALTNINLGYLENLGKKHPGLTISFQEYGLKLLVRDPAGNE